MPLPLSSIHSSQNLAVAATEGSGLSAPSTGEVAAGEADNGTKVLVDLHRALLNGFLLTLAEEGVPTPELSPDCDWVEALATVLQAGLLYDCYVITM